MGSVNISGFTNSRTSLLTHVTWSPDDRFIVGCFGDRNPELIDPRTKQTIRQFVVPSADQPRGQEAFEEVGGFIAAWSPDCHQVAIGRHRMVYIVDATTGGIRSNHAIRMHPVSAEESLNLLSRDPVLGRLPPIGTPEQQLARINQFIDASTPGLSTLRWDATGISIGTAIGAYRLDLVNGSKMISLRPNPCPGLVKSPVVSPNGKFLAGLFIPDVDVLGDLFWNFNRALNIGRRVLQIWNLESGSLETSYQGDDLPDWKDCRLVWSSDSAKLAWGHDNTVLIFEIFKNAARVLARSQDDHIRFMAWHPHYNQLAVHDSTDGIVVYDTISNVRRSAYRDAFWSKFKDSNERVFAWSNSGESIAVGVQNRSIEVWRAS
jgi:WD40 repeat protein